MANFSYLPTSHEQGLTKPYAVQYNMTQTSPIMTYEQDDRDERYGGGSLADRGRNDSGLSNISGVSMSSSNLTYDSFTSPSTPTGNPSWGYNPIPKTEDDSSSLTPPAEYYTVPPGSQFIPHDEHDATRWTPITLEWTTNSKLLNLYKFVVRKSKEPYFELLDPYTPTFETPSRVYLDHPEYVHLSRTK